YEEEEVTFEMIINVIEEFIIYYSYNNSDRKTSSLMKCFLISDGIDNLLNFSIPGGVSKHGYKLDIPVDKPYDYSNNAYQNETPEQFFFQHLLAEILTNISSRIINYSYNTGSHSKIDHICRV